MTATVIGVVLILVLFVSPLPEALWSRVQDRRFAREARRKGWIGYK